jgi:hypothetical protein
VNAVAVAVAVAVAGSFGLPSGRVVAVVWLGNADKGVSG